MITMFLMLFIILGIIGVIISAAFSILRWIFSIPIIGTLAVILLIMFLFFRW